MPRPGLIALMGRPPAAGPPGGQLFTDDFNRADDATGLGSNWPRAGYYATTGVIGITSNRAAPVTGAVKQNAVVYGTPCNTDDNFSQITNPVHNNSYRYVMCRSSDTERTHYLLNHNAPGNALELWKLVAGVETLLDSYSVNEYLGMVFRLEASGSTISGYLDGVLRVQATDSAIPTGKYVGFGAYTAGTIPTFDDWSGGDL